MPFVNLGKAVQDGAPCQKRKFFVRNAFLPREDTMQFVFVPERVCSKMYMIDVDEKTLEKRITGRRTCENCKAIFNINVKEMTPAIDSVCDICGSKLYQRSDDNLEAFKNRYKMYNEKTKPIIEYYEKKGVLKKIDGNNTPEEVFKMVDEIISKD